MLAGKTVNNGIKRDLRQQHNWPGRSCRRHRW
jgi:hypothetical protein